MAPPILDTADRFAKAVKARKKDLSAPKILEEEKVAGSQEYDKVLEACVRALRQHVKVINRNSRVLSEQGKMIEDLTAQAQEHAVVLDAVSRLVHVLIWISAVSFIMAAAAVLMAVFK